MTSDDLADKARDALLTAAKRNGRRVAVSRADVMASNDVVLDEVMRIVYARLSNDWGGNAVMAELRKLRA
jgi:hypothetical protein